LPAQAKPAPRRQQARFATTRNTNVKLEEPPSCSSASTITFIGRNSRGNWVAQEQNGLYGGLFVNRTQAETIVELAREIELDPNGTRAGYRQRA